MSNKHWQADVIAAYALRAQFSSTPYDVLQVKVNGKWQDCRDNPLFGCSIEYRVKPFD